ncbi:hypothetical protein [Pseudomonas sp. P8_250]|uniref:hypothetical protein n=1 Tax=Pseudomonas sp. P8_250 TaxID=3043446 RepID=UPI002A3622C7|nr:hypothetical protein [Pseudomonas sp. P8_250]MDX9668747.1 hypothetical protein [Pseudomonas sp. P8_250]
MTWVYIIPLFFLTDGLLYMACWQKFAKQFHFMNYGIAVGWMMAYKLSKKDA